MKSSLFILCFLIAAVAVGQNKSLGLFSDETDIGKKVLKGSTTYDKKTKEYTIEGAGANIWGTHDEFHFVWKKMKGDFVAKTNGAFVGKGVELHRKWGWMVRTSLDTSATHVNGVEHGDGLTSLQYRKASAAVTEEKKFTLTHANMIQLERKGNTYIMTATKKDGTTAREQVEVNIGDEVYVGLFVCSHNKGVAEKAVFSKVSVGK